MHKVRCFFSLTIPPVRSQPPPGYSERLASEKKATHLVHSDLLEQAMVRKVGVNRQGDVQAASSLGGWETPYILPTSKAVFAHQTAAFPVLAR